MWKASDPGKGSTYWDHKDWKMFQCTTSESAETKALLEGIRIAADVVSGRTLNIDTQGTVEHVVIYTDALYLLDKYRALRDSAWGNTQWDNCLRVSQPLPALQTIFNAGVLLELRWVPSHSKVPGNEEVDERAVAARLYM